MQEKLSIGVGRSKVLYYNGTNPPTAANAFQRCIYSFAFGVRLGRSFFLFV
jgi:hypothetical protein